MSSTGLDVFDKTLQTTHIWLDEIMSVVGPSRSIAWHVLGTVLRRLRDRLPPELAVHLGAQLPLLVRGIYYDQWKLSYVPDRTRDYDDFLEEIEEGLSDTRPVNVDDAVRAVFGVLSRHVDPGQITKVRHALPEDIRRAWPEDAGRFIRQQDQAS